MRLKIVWLAKLKDPIHIYWGAIEESCEYCNTYHSHQDTNHCRQWVSQFQIERLTESAKIILSSFVIDLGDTDLVDFVFVFVMEHRSVEYSNQVTCVCTLVWFPNPLTPGSDIQIHVSWGTRLVYACVCVRERDFGDIVCQIAHDMTTCGWSDVLKRRRRRRRLQLINNHADSLMAARRGRYLLLTREYGKSWVSTRYRAQYIKCYSALLNLY